MNAPEARVSVVIPVRDRADLLDRCLAALAPQLGEDREAIVVDDGSTDGSGEVATRWAATAPVRVLDAGGRGAVEARALGVEASTAEVLAFTDSDCEPSPGWLDAGLAAIDRGADLVQGRTTPARPCGVLERSMWATREDGLYATCNLFVRRTAYDAAGGFDRHAGDRLGTADGPLVGRGFGEDTILGWRIRRAGCHRCFSEEAHVAHHVFPFDLRDHVMRAWQAGGFSQLVREVPELRRELLVGGVFLGTPRRVPLYLAGLAVAVGRRRTAGASAAVWVGMVGRQVLRHERGPRRRALALLVLVLDDAVSGASLVRASARTGSVVL